MARAPVALADVARRAGVSLSTASRVINGSARRVTPELEQRVTAAAAGLGHTPNVQAQALTASVPEISPYKIKNAARGSHDREDLFFGVSFLYLYDELFTSGIKSSRS